MNWIFGIGVQKAVFIWLVLNKRSASIIGTSDDAKDTLVVNKPIAATTTAALFRIFPNHPCSTTG
jgi:hypothetical protein